LNQIYLDFLCRSPSISSLSQPDVAADETSEGTPVIGTAGMKEQLMQDFAIAAESSEASDTEDTEVNRTGESVDNNLRPICRAFTYR